MYVPAYGIATKTDSELIDRILASKQGDKFRRLLDGDISKYPSHSNADYAFCKILAWWTNDFWQIDRIFRSSGLYREKWDSRRGNGTYGSNIIDSVMSSQSPRVFRFSENAMEM